MKIKSILFLILFNGFANAQNAISVVDSLLIALKTAKNDTVQSRIYIRLASNLQQENPIKALFYANKGLLIVKKMNWSKGLAVYNNDIGNIHLNQSNHQEALKFFLKSLEYSVEIKSLRAITLQNISLVYLKEENIPMAIKYNKLAFELAKNQNFNETLGNCQATFGNIFLHEKQISKAKIYFLKSLEIWKQENNKVQQATLLMNLGEIENDAKYKIRYYQLSKAIWDVENPSFLLAVSNAMGLAEEYTKLAKNNNAYIKSGIKIPRNELIFRAETILNDAIKFSKQSNVQQNLMYAYGKLSELEEIKGNYKKALEYINLNYEIYIAIFSQENKNKIAELENQKAIAIKNHEIEVENNEKIKQKWIFGFILTFLIVIAFELLRQNNIRKRTNQKLQILNNDLDLANKNKAFFFSILNHDLRRPISNLVDYMNVKKDSPELITEFDRLEIDNNTITAAENLLSSMEDMLLWSKSQMQNFKPQFKSVVINSLFDDTKNYFASIRKINIVFENPENLTIYTDDNYLKTIIRNLTGNAVKALVETQHPMIVWKAWQQAGKTYLSVTDNGSGAIQEQFKALFDDTELVGIKTGLGFHLIRDLAKAIDCDVSVESKINEGTTFILKM